MSSLTEESRRNRRLALEDALATRVLVLDGAMGTMLQDRQLTAADFGGPALEGCNENLVLTRPDVMLDIHRAYFEAGSDMVETNSFQSSKIVLAEFGLADRSYEISFTAAKLAREAADEFSISGRMRFVAGSMGPTTKAISISGGITFAELIDSFYDQSKGLIDGGADILLLETCNDTRTVKAGLLAISRLGKELGFRIPVMVSGTIEQMGTMLAGQPADAFYASVAHADLLAVGLNCATGPEFMTDHIRTIHELATTRISCYPNAGLPMTNGSIPRDAGDAGRAARELRRSRLAEHRRRLLRHPARSYPRHRANGRRQEAARRERAVRTALITPASKLVEAEDSNRPLIVGERTNVIGSRLFKKLIAEEKWEEASEIARRQVKNGAHIIDVCLQSSDRDEMNDIPPFYEKLIRKIKAPIMIDTTDPRSIELALTYCQGKSIINSINLEDGEEKFERICPLARELWRGAGGGTIDEDKLQAQAFTRERKLAVAQRSVELLTAKYGIPPEDIIIDPLVFPCATGDENYIGGAVETIEAIRLIKEKIPYVKTILGISNISFGLPAAAREVVNSVFLYYCTKAGLDLAIVNAEKLERFASIPPEERRLAEACSSTRRRSMFLPVIPMPRSFERPEDWRQQSRDQKVADQSVPHRRHHRAFPRGNRKTGRRKRADLPLDERLANYIIEGTKDGLIPDLDRKRAEGAAPLDIINGPLMAGMSEVGRLFNNNELIVAEVLQSAEAMKAAVNHLEQFMEKSETSARGKIVLATVKGDVHDIGKNLVEIILSNNGYRGGQPRHQGSAGRI